MERRNNEKVETTANEAIGILETLTEVPTKPEDVVPLNIDKALASYTEAERKEIMDLANQFTDYGFQSRRNPLCQPDRVKNRESDVQHGYCTIMKKGD